VSKEIVGRGNAVDGVLPEGLRKLAHALLAHLLPSWCKCAYVQCLKLGGQSRHAIKTRPQRRLTQAELDAFLEKAADMLRGGVDHSEFRGYVFALLFYKRINDGYLEKVVARFLWNLASPHISL
jgi:hypothetical protein